jgi:hypothetical protein
MEGVKGLRPMLDAVTGGAYSRALDSRKSEPAGPRAVVYGPGRGLWHEGAWWLTRGPGAMGGSAKQRSAGEAAASCKGPASRSVTTVRARAAASFR